jgi:hypothetical protein
MLISSNGKMYSAVSIYNLYIMFSSTWICTLWNHIMCTYSLLEFSYKFFPISWIDITANLNIQDEW